MSTINEYSQMIQHNPNDAELFIKRGNLFFNDNNYDSAFTDYTKAIDLGSDNYDAYNSRGLIYFVIKKELNKAIADFTDAIRLSPNATNTYLMRGDVYNQIEEFDKAIADFDKVIEVNPEDPRVFFNRGSAYLTKGNRKQKESDFTQGISLIKKGINDFEAALKLNLPEQMKELCTKMLNVAQRQLITFQDLEKGHQNLKDAGLFN